MTAGTTLVSVTAVAIHGRTQHPLPVRRKPDGTLSVQVLNPHAKHFLEIRTVTNQVNGCLVCEDNYKQDTGRIPNNGSQRVPIGKLGRKLQRNFCLQPYCGSPDNGLCSEEDHFQVILTAPSLEDSGTVSMTSRKSNNSSVIRQRGRGRGHSVRHNHAVAVPR